MLRFLDQRSNVSLQQTGHLRWRAARTKLGGFPPQVSFGVDRYMGTRVRQARAIAIEMGTLGAFLGAVNAVLIGQSQPAWARLAVPLLSFILFFTIAFPLAYAFPALVDPSVRDEASHKGRFARGAPFWWTVFGLLLGLLLLLAVWLGGVLARTV